MIRIIVIFLSAVCIFIFTAVFIFFSKLPSRAEFLSCFKTSMFQVYLCPDSSEFIRFKDISNNLKSSILISEDAAFYSHKGFDWISIQSSLNKNLEKKKIVRGGSTITQQLIKNMYFSSEKSISRKILEMIYTAKIEKELTKTEIFELYLNVIEFGPDVFGIKNASRFYFNKTPGELSIVESAFLAMLLPNPLKNSSSFFKKKLTEFSYLRITKILNDLYSMNKINELDLQSAKSELNTFLNGYQGPIDKSDELLTEDDPTSI